MSGRAPPLLLAAALGAMSGVRSMSGPAALAHRLNVTPRRAGEAVAVRCLRSPAVARALFALAAAEAVWDKLPVIPARTEPLPLAGRAALGGLAAAVLGLAWRRGASSGDVRLPWATAGVAAAAATLTAAGATALRRRLTDRGAPDLLIGLLEDGVVLAAGTALAAPGERPGSPRRAS